MGVQESVEALVAIVPPFERRVFDVRASLRNDELDLYYRLVSELEGECRKTAPQTFDSNCWVDGCISLKVSIMGLNTYSISGVFICGEPDQVSGKQWGIPFVIAMQNGAGAVIVSDAVSLARVHRYSNRNGFLTIEVLRMRRNTGG